MSDQEAEITTRYTRTDSLKGQSEVAESPDSELLKLVERIEELRSSLTREYSPIVLADLRDQVELLQARLRGFGFSCSENGDGGKSLVCNAQVKQFEQLIKEFLEDVKKRRFQGARRRAAKYDFRSFVAESSYLSHEERRNKPFQGAVFNVAQGLTNELLNPLIHSLERGVGFNALEYLAQINQIFEEFFSAAYYGHWLERGDEIRELAVDRNSMLYRGGYFTEGAEEMPLIKALIHRFTILTLFKLLGGQLGPNFYQYLDDISSNKPEVSQQLDEFRKNLRRASRHYLIADFRTSLELMRDGDEDELLRVRREKVEHYSQKRAQYEQRMRTILDKPSELATVAQDIVQRQDDEPARELTKSVPPNPPLDLEPNSYVIRRQVISKWLESLGIKSKLFQQLPERSEKALWELYRHSIELRLTFQEQRKLIWRFSKVVGVVGLIMLIPSSNAIQINPQAAIEAFVHITEPLTKLNQRKTVAGEMPKATRELAQAGPSGVLDKIKSAITRVFSPESPAPINPPAMTIGQKRDLFETATPSYRAFIRESIEITSNNSNIWDGFNELILQYFGKGWSRYNPELSREVTRADVIVDYILKRLDLPDTRAVRLGDVFRMRKLISKELWQQIVKISKTSNYQEYLQLLRK